MSYLFLILTTIMPPCEYEDSTNCYWNANTMGNGYGDSFVSIGYINLYEAKEDI